MTNDPARIKAKDAQKQDTLEEFPSNQPEVEVKYSLKLVANIATRLLAAENRGVVELSHSSRETKARLKMAAQAAVGILDASVEVLKDEALRFYKMQVYESEVEEWNKLHADKDLGAFATAVKVITGKYPRDIAPAFKRFLAFALKYQRVFCDEALPHEVEDLDLEAAEKVIVDWKTFRRMPFELCRRPNPALKLSYLFKFWYNELYLRCQKEAAGRSKKGGGDAAKTFSRSHKLHAEKQLRMMEDCHLQSIRDERHQKRLDLKSLTRV